MVIPKGHMSFHQLPDLSRQLGQPQRPAATGDLAAPAGRGERIPAVPALLRAAAGYDHDELVRRTPDGRPDYSDPAYCPTLWRA